MITQTINLNLIPGSPQPRINVSQYDNGSRTLQFNLYNGVSPYEIPSGASVSIVGTKADNTGFEYACTFDGSLVSVDITDQMTVFAGEVQSELQIRQSGEILGTANFIINVERAALSDDTQISETDIPIIQRIPEILEEAEEYADTAHKWATFGADTETPSSTNNAKYWAEQSQVYAAGALHWKASVTFANIPTSGMIVGDFYNITDDFTTDSRFDEGAGIKCSAGTNIVWDTNNKWDILTPSTVASQVKYDGTTSGLSATNVQSAIDEVNSVKTTLVTFSDLPKYGIATSGTEQINATLEEICKKVPAFCEVKIMWIGNDTTRFGTIASQMPEGFGSLYIHKNGYNRPCIIEFVQYASGNHYVRNFDYINADHLSEWVNLNTVGYAIASNEPTATSSRAYSVGQYMVRGGNLKKVTSAIASGESITGNNTSNTTVGAELTQINQGLSSINSDLSNIKYQEFTTRDGNTDFASVNPDFLNTGYVSVFKYGKQVTIHVEGVSSKSTGDWIFQIASSYRPYAGGAGGSNIYFGYYLGNTSCRGYINVSSGHLYFETLTTSDKLSATITYNIA